MITKRTCCDGLDGWRVLDGLRDSREAVCKLLACLFGDPDVALGGRGRAEELATAPLLNGRAVSALAGNRGGIIMIHELNDGRCCSCRSVYVRWEMCR